MFLRISILLVTAVMGASIFVGCGGGGQANVGGRDSLSGVVKSADVDKRRVKVKPKGEEAQIFKYNPENVKIELNGEEASLAEIKEGQRAEIEYVVKEDRNIARSITLTTEGGNPSAAGGG